MEIWEKIFDVITSETVKAGILASLLATSIWVLGSKYGPILLEFLLRFRTRLFWGSSRYFKDKTIIVPDVLEIDYPPLKDLFFLKINRNHHINGPRKVYGESNISSIQYINQTFGKFTRHAPKIKNDLEVKNLWDANLICLGSSSSNIKTHDILNRQFTHFARFIQDSKGVAIQTFWNNKKYRIDGRYDKGLVMKIRSPINKKFWIIICAGLGSTGTSASTYYLMRNWKSLFWKYFNKDFCLILNVDGGNDLSVDKIAEYFY